MARNLMPERLFSAAEKLLSEFDRYSIEWDAGTKRRVASEFEEDARMFLEYCGKPPDFWSLSDG